MRTFALLLVAAACTPAIPEPALPADDLDAAFPPPTPCAPGAEAMYDGGAYTYLTDAIADATTPFSVVTVCAGVHAGGLDITSPGPIWLAGETGDPADVILDGGGAQGILAANDPAAVLRLTGLTLRNGFADFRTNGDVVGGVSHLADQGQLVVQGCVFTQNVSVSDPAGAIESYAPQVLIERSRFEENRGGTAAALTLIHYQRGAVLTLRDLEIVHNTTNGVGAVLIGGGLNQPPPGRDRYTLERVELRGNEGGSVAGMTVQPVHPVDLQVIDSTFAENRSQGFAGALHVFRFGVAANQRLLLANTTFIDNVADAAPAFLLSGGPPFDPAGEAFMRGGAILRNTATVTPGAMQLRDRWAMAMRDVDLGAGVNDNTGDVAGCAMALGAGTRGLIVPNQGDLCP
jgi:hypothetical protein